MNEHDRKVTNFSASVSSDFSSDQRKVFNESVSTDRLSERSFISNYSVFIIIEKYI